MKKLTALLTLILLTACSTFGAIEKAPPITPISGFQSAQIEALRTEHQAETIGIGIIINGQLVKTAYFGEQSPGVPASAATMFNTASMNKAVTTETFLRLAEKGLVNIDEPIAPHYIHPDLADDPRYAKLTPRIILIHKTGLLNWAYEYDDDKLAFRHDPGAKYGYSGAGFMILANFLENKIGKPFPQIVREEVFDPLAMKNASIIQKPWMKGKVVQALLPKGGFDPEFALDIGYWNSADELFVTVEDYAKFLISVMDGEDVGPALSTERLRVQSDLTDNAIWGCDDGKVDPCPSPYGHGLGWFIFGFDGNLNVQHGGNDRSEAAIGYFETGTRDGMIVFVNAPSPQGVLLWPKIVDVLDPDAKFVGVYHYVISKFFKATPPE